MFYKYHFIFRLKAQDGLVEVMECESEGRHRWNHYMPGWDYMEIEVHARNFIFRVAALPSCRVAVCLKQNSHQVLSL